MALKVESAPGPRGEPEPTTVWFGERRVGVRAIVDRWFAPMQRWYRVDADDDQLYVLRHDLASHAWDLVALTRRDALPEGAELFLRARPRSGLPT
jgi:hypothetical protein